MILPDTVAARMMGHSVSFTLKLIITGLRKEINNKQLTMLFQNLKTMNKIKKYL